MRQFTAAFFSILFIFTAVFFKIPSALAGETVIRPAAPAIGYYFCTALEDPTESNPKGKAYYSGAFMVEGDASKALVPVREAYVKFLQEKYAYVQDPANFNTMITFTGVSSMDMAVSTLEARVNAGKRANPEGTIETGWTYQAN